METVRINSYVQVSDTKELSIVLSKLDYPKLDPLEKMNFWLDEIWLNIHLSGTSDLLDEFEKILKKVAPFIEKEENFYAHVSDSYGERDILYVFKENTFYKYREYCCYPDYGFYPLDVNAIINGIKSNKVLKEKITESLIENNEESDYKHKFDALVNFIDKKYGNFKGEYSFLPINILDEIATEAYKLKLETNYYGKENKK